MAFDDLDDLDLDEDDNIDFTFLTFAVGEEEYAIPVAHVTEIVRLQKVFAIPDVEPHVRGVINLRGKVIPLLDVRARFGLKNTAYSDRTIIIVIEVDNTPTGLIVDDVFDIASCAPEQIEPASSITRSSGRDTLVTGICKRDERVSFILDVNRMVVSRPPLASAA